MKIPEIKISFKLGNVKKSELTQITSSRDGYEVFKQIFDADTIDWIEEAIVLCLNRANKVVGFYKLSSGGVGGVIMDTKVVYTVALNCGASSIIIAHNHPSGQLNPSDADIRITENLRKAGTIMDIPLLDHIIVTDEGYYSFGDDGKL
jgi:DNA repair protein RadC